MSSLENTLFVIQRELVRYIYPIYLIFGVIGCFLNIILLTRRQFRTVSCCIYFNMASVTMLITLLAGTTPFIYAINHTNPYTTIVAFCKIRAYLIQSTAMMYRWCLAIACIDRYALTSTNARLRNFAKVNIAYRVIITIIVIWLVLPVYILVVFNMEDGRCGVLNDIGGAFYYSIYMIISGSLLPVSVMIICALLIRHNLMIKRQHLRRLTNNQSVQQNRDQQVFLMLLLHALVYLITQTPFMLFSLYNAATIYVTNKSNDQEAIEQFINFITECIIYLLPTLSFYLYTLASRRFRDEFMKLLLYVFNHRHINHINRIHPLANNSLIRKHNEQPIHMLAYS